MAESASETAILPFSHEIICMAKLASTGVSIHSTDRSFCPEPKLLVGLSLFSPIYKFGLCNGISRTGQALMMLLHMALTFSTRLSL